MRVRRRGAAVAAVVAVLLVAGVIALAVALRQPAAAAARNIRIAVGDGPRAHQRVLLDAGRCTPAGHGRVPGILLSPGVGGTKRAVRGPAPGRSGATHRTTTSRTPASWSAGWPGSPGCSWTGAVTPGPALPAPPTAAGSRCAPPRMTTGSTPWWRRAPGTTWPPRC